MRRYSTFKHHGAEQIHEAQITHQRAVEQPPQLNRADVDAQIARADSNGNGKQKSPGK